MTKSVALWKTRRLVGVLAALGCVWCLATTPARADLIAFEGFDYPDSDANDPVLDLNGGAGWDGAWSAFGAISTAVTYQPDSLSIPNSPGDSVGGRAKVTNGGGQKAIARQFDGVDFNTEGNELFVSFYISKDRMSSSSSENLELNLLGTESATDRTRIGITSDEFFFSFNTTSSIQAELGKTYLVVFKMESGVGDDLDQQYIAIYGENDSVPVDEPDDLMWSFTDEQNFTFEFNTLRLLAGTNGSGSFDEIRIGTTWADVVPPSAAAVPEPAAFVLVGLVLAAAVGVRFGRRQK